MTPIDPVSDQAAPNKMVWVEFMEFIARIAHEFYKEGEGGEHRREPLPTKIDLFVEKLYGKLFRMEYIRQDAPAQPVKTPKQGTGIS